MTHSQFLVNYNLTNWSLASQTTWLLSIPWVILILYLTQDTFQRISWVFKEGIPSDHVSKTEQSPCLLWTVLVFAFMSAWVGCSLAPASFIPQYNFKDITSRGSLEGGRVMYHYSGHHIFHQRQVGRFIFLCKKCHNVAHFLHNVLKHYLYYSVTVFSADLSIYPFRN